MLKIKILQTIIWIIFIYLSYITALSFGYLPGILVLFTIIGGAIISQILYKIFYKKDIIFYNFLLYPLIYIFITIGLTIIPDTTTGVYEFSNGKKNIIFQGMHHVGTQQYYLQVIDNIQKYRGLGYKIVYEGIKMEESDVPVEIDTQLENIFNVTDFLKNKFLFFEGELIDDYSRKPEDLNIDITNTKIQELFLKQQMSNNEGQVHDHINIIAGVNSGSKINNFIYNFKSQYITIMDYKIMTLYYNLGTYLSINNYNTNKHILDSILIDYRDKYLYENIMELRDNNIFIIYGEGHVNGFYELLNQNGSYNSKRIQTLKPFDN